MPSRREVLKASMVAPVAALGHVRQPRGPRVLVVGSGAFGGWTALGLVRRGARVTLIDAWGPGNIRASSGGETRVIRATYGTRTIYTRMAKRAMDLWRAHDAQFQTQFFHRTGALWMFGHGREAGFGRASTEVLKAEGLPLEDLSLADAAKRFPQISFEQVASVLYEPEAGFLLARRACEHVALRARAEGAEVKLAAIRSPLRIDGPLTRAILADESSIAADAFVFACGPWLGSLVPDVIGDRVTPTRQDVFYFGPSAGDERHTEQRLPVWVDYGERLIYGIPGNANRGFKIADDTPGPRFDPTGGDRDVTEASIATARGHMERRFPGMRGAPFVGAEVCQYEASPDSDYIIDRHPRAANVWLVGGGSGHGFKMGPAVGEIVADAVLDRATPDPAFALSRFANRSREGADREKWS